MQVAGYAVMSAPPLDSGAENESFTLPSPALATTLVGDPGTVAEMLLEPPSPPPHAERATAKVAIADRNEMFMAWLDDGNVCRNGFVSLTVNPVPMDYAKNETFVIQSASATSA
jgi:hypothetical protein